MARFTLKIAKAQVLRKQLNALPDKAKKRVESALAEAGESIVNLARQLLDSHGIKGKGVLRASIRWAYASEDKNSIKVGPSTEYLEAHDRIANLPRWIEFGTNSYAKGEKYRYKLSNRGKVKTRKRGLAGREQVSAHAGMPARPFLFPAYAARKKNLRRGIAEAVNLSLKDTAKDNSGG